MKAIPAGATVRCGHCNEAIYTLRRAVVIGTPLCASLFEGHPTVRDGVSNPCPGCGGEWFWLWLREIEDETTAIFRKA